MLNAAGLFFFVMCRDCGSVDQCPNCDISLTLHMDTKTMNCHYCGFQKGIPQTCPNCQSRSIRYYGTGTQKAYDELQEICQKLEFCVWMWILPRKGAHEDLLEQVWSRAKRIFFWEVPYDCQGLGFSKCDAGRGA